MNLDTCTKLDNSLKPADFGTGTCARELKVAIMSLVMAHHQAYGMTMFDLAIFRKALAFLPFREL